MKKTEILAAAGIGLTALAAVAVANASETQNFSYDARGRLVNVQHSGSVNANVLTRYEYDKADNRTLKNVIGAP
ncbi:RHS repeat domain-containing protein [Allosphingosinicella sp.]|uniref:RHS repeat domain-containing protein n=1 Tax=Allosphingosinicella sp. TaxID=2823234 RepID=UPI00378472F6